MTPKEFDQLTQAAWSPILQQQYGFAFAEGAYSRELTDGTRHVILLDFDVRNAKTFRMIVGFNSAAIAGNMSPVEAGVFGVRYLDEVGFTSKPKNFPCFNPDAAKASLFQILEVVRDVVCPWFSEYQSAATVAELVETQYPFIRGKLLVQAGRLEAAKRELLRHQEYLKAQPQTAIVMQGLKETADLLAHCS